MSLLTDKEISSAFEKSDGTWVSAGRLIEAAVIKKLHEQEPVAWWNGKETAFFEHETDGPIGEVSIPLYLHPQPLEAK